MREFTGKQALLGLFRGKQGESSPEIERTQFPSVTLLNRGLRVQCPVARPIPSVMIKAGKYYSASCLCSGELQNSISGYKGFTLHPFMQQGMPNCKVIKLLFGWYYPGKAPWQLTFTGFTSFNRHLSFDHGQYIPYGTLSIL